MSSMLHHMNGMDEMSKVTGILKILRVTKKRMHLMKKEVRKLIKKAKEKKTMNGNGEEHG
eukprot:12453173-Prorocentrum_lima.AAC.1